MKPLALIFALALPAAAAAQAPDTARYAVLLGGHPVGSQEVWRDADGSIAAHYTYKDRQRGPEVVQRTWLSPAGVPTRIALDGTDYLGNRVAERYEVANGRASWTTASGTSGAPSPAPAFYLSVDGTPEQAALLARALLAAPGRRLALFPGGSAAIEPASRLTVRGEGGERQVTQYLLTGVQLTPLSVWLDADGQLFAQGDPGFVAIRQGFESSAPALLDAQVATAAHRADSLAHALAGHDGPLVIRHARVLDVAGGRVIGGQAVVVQAGRIAWTGPDARVRVPAGARTIDARGRLVMPGMWDMHVHLRDEHPLQHLAAGVTTVRDMGNIRARLADIRRRIDAGSLLGPRVLAAGMIDGPSSYGSPSDVLVTTRAQAEAAVDSFAAAGYAQIKIYSSLDTALVPVVIAAAHRHHLRVGGHVPAFMTADAMVRDGADELNHVNFLLLNFWADSVKDTRTMARVTSVANRAAGFDLHGQAWTDFVGLLREHHVVVDPTINVFERLLLGRKGVPYPGYEQLAERLPVLSRRELFLGGLPAPDEEHAELYRGSMGTLLAIVRSLHDAGIPLVAGTDGLPGFSYPRELELYAQAGIPTADVLRIATLGAARVMGMERDFGTVEAGKTADLLLIDGDPLARISDVRRIDLVIRGGRVYDHAALVQAMGMAR